MTAWRSGGRDAFPITGELLRESPGCCPAHFTLRGYANAGVYNPSGVGGTNVVHILRHADNPEAYSGLPKDPVISPMVALWKGAFKPLALLGIGLTALAGFFHYVKVGPNETEEEA